MKILSAVLILVLVSCTASRETTALSSSVANQEAYPYFAGLGWRSDTRYQGSSLRHPVYEVLKKAGIDCYKGDHAGRLTALYCLRSDAPRARAIIARLPEDLQELVFYPDRE